MLADFFFCFRKTVVRHFYSNSVFYTSPKISQLSDVTDVKPSCITLVPFKSDLKSVVIEKLTLIILTFRC